MIDATIVVMAKEPIPGRVKTRLAPPCTPVEAAAIAEAALAQTLQAVAATPSIDGLLALEGSAGAWLPNGFPVVPQCDGHLADRLTDACRSVSGPVVVVGMDTPQVTTELLRHVVDELRTSGTDAVLGLTVDGGFWTLGLREPTLPVFDGVPMSSPSTGRLQLARLHDLGLRVRKAPVLVDVDDFASARFVADLVPGTRFAAVVERTARSHSQAIHGSAESRLS